MLNQFCFSTKPAVEDAKDASDGEFAIAEELSKQGKDSLEVK